MQNQLPAGEAGATQGLIWAIVACSALAASVLLAAPLLVGAFIRDVGFTEAQAGYVISAELAGMAFATLPAYVWLRHVKTCSALRATIGIFSLGNLLTALALYQGLEFLPLLVLRFLVATAAGSIMIICMTTIRLYPQPDRLYGFFVLGQLLFGAILVAILPQLFVIAGIYSFYVLIFLLTLLTAPLAGHFPVKINTAPATASTNAGQGWLLPALCLIGVFLFYVSLGGMWTYMERIGVNASLAPATIGYIFSGATIIGVLGAAAAAWVGGKPMAQVGSMLGGLAVLSLSIFMLLGQQDIISFIAATGLFKFCWSFALPFLLGIVARIDLQGRIMTTINLVIGGGTATGPAVAAWILAGDTHYDHMVSLFLGTSLTSLTLMAIVASKIYRPHD